MSEKADTQKSTQVKGSAAYIVAKELIDEDKESVRPVTITETTEQPEHLGQSRSESDVSQTPKCGLKRFLTPSPANKADSLKKIRQVSGEVSEICELEEGAVSMIVGMEPELVAVPMDLKDVTRVATELKELMLPEIGELNCGQMPDIDSIVNKAVESAVNRITDTLAHEVVSVKKENAELKLQNAELRTSLGKLEARVSKVEEAADFNEQYSRRNCIRISGIKEENNEDTDRIVLNMARDLNANLSLADLDRSHRVGKPKVGHERPIIVKFATYRARQSLYLKRLDLLAKDGWKNVFINEDLTARRNKLLFNARQYVKTSLVKSAYYSDGKIFVRDNRDKKHMIYTKEDLEAFGTLPVPRTDSREASTRAGATGP